MLIWTAGQDNSPATTWSAMGGLKQAVSCIYMYYMLVRLSVCLNHIKGTI